MPARLATTTMMPHINIMYAVDEKTKEINLVDIDRNPSEKFSPYYLEYSIKTEFTVNATDVTVHWDDLALPEMLPPEEEIDKVHNMIAVFVTRIIKNITSQN